MNRYKKLIELKESGIISAEEAREILEKWDKEKNLREWLIELFSFKKKPKSK